MDQLVIEDQVMNRPIRVLVVEDSTQMGEFLKVALPEKDASITVDHVTGLIEAVERLKVYRPDAILLDLLLPDAEDVTAIVRLQELEPEIPIVVLSGLGSSLEGPAMQAGAQDYIGKGGLDSTPEYIIRALRHAVIRNEVHRRFDRAHRSMDSTEQALKECERLEKIVTETKSPWQPTKEMSHAPCSLRRSLAGNHRCCGNGGQGILRRKKS